MELEKRFVQPVEKNLCLRHRPSTSTTDSGIFCIIVILQRGSGKPSCMKRATYSDRALHRMCQHLTDDWIAEVNSARNQEAMTRLASNGVASILRLAVGTLSKPRHVKPNEGHQFRRASNVARSRGVINQPKLLLCIQRTCHCVSFPANNQCNELARD